MQRRFSTLWYAVGASFVAHLIAIVLSAQWANPPAPGAPLTIEIDIETPPPAPLADDLSAAALAEAVAPPIIVPAAVQPAVAEAPPEQPVLDEPDEAVALALDAGVADAGVADAEATPLIAEGAATDGGAAALADLPDGGTDDGGAALASGDSDGGNGSLASVTAATDGDGGPSDGGPAALAVAEQVRDGGAGLATAPTTPLSAADATTTTASGAAPPGEGGGAAPPAIGSAADLLAHVPKGEVLAVLVRFDRLRGTEWAPRASALLAPLPDYQTLVGDRPGELADWLDSLAITSADPRDVASTTLIARGAETLGDPRAFVDGAGARVQWLAAKGGILGRRLPGPRVYPGDARVFFLPRLRWILLTHKAWLGDAATPTGAALDDALAAALPGSTWLARIDELEAEAGAGDIPGPALLVTAAGLPPRIEAPGILEVPGPHQITLALEVHDSGFVVRGNFVFEDAKSAEAFRLGVSEAKDKYTSTALGKLMLNRAKAYNAIAGLSLRRTDARVSYATSISIADARLMMDALAIRVRDYFTARTQPR